MDGQDINQKIYNSSNWVNMLNEGHDTKQDTMYSMTIPLESLGIDKNYIENNGIGVMHISTFGQSGIGSLPHDKSMLDVATEEYGPDSSTSAEKEDYDVITTALARIGKKEIIENQKLEIKSIKTDKEIGNIGTEVKITADTTGGKDIIYSFSVHEIKDGWKNISDFSASDTTTWIPTKKGKYKIWVDVKDSSNNKTSKYIDYTVN